MKLKFKHQQFQADAAQAVVHCFTGQPKGHRIETVDRKILHTAWGKETIDKNIFANNSIQISEADILKNVQSIQKSQNLKLSQKLQGLNFTIEMETGTGKTYVYTKTIYELHKHYGWSKFIIMVPSVAIREGVHKSLEITADHFQEDYGQKIRFSIYNTQNKSNLINIKNFADTGNIEVIIMNYQAFATTSKEARKIYQRLDSLQSEKPIDIIKRTRPVLIIDEPQRFGDKAEKIFTDNEFNQLFILRYSATHKKDYNKIYRLDAIDAFNQKLVKKISVKGIEVTGNAGTNSYLYLDRIEVSTTRYPIAYLEFEVRQANGIKKQIRKIESGTNLYELSNRLQQYKDYVVSDINARTNKVSFKNGKQLSVGQNVGDVDEEHVRRIQIRETIKSHIEKERLMFTKGIKVLSLFFIDEVAKYRDYEATDQKGIYARIFEEEYNNATCQLNLFEEAYSSYLCKHSAESVHQGYFSIDKKGKFVNSKIKRGEAGSDDESAYELIMKNKEKLLSFAEPTRFIFSHSALREGWDNPNVFQICTLKHSDSQISKRQEIGRGLRICVNDQGDRMDYTVLDEDFFEINKLTVVASESYDSFAKTLQKEIIESLSERPVVLTQSILANKVLKNAEGQEFVFNDRTAMDFIFDLKSNRYLDDNYQITDTLITDIKAKTYTVPENLQGFENCVQEMLQEIYDTANFKPVSNENDKNIELKNLTPNENFAKAEFKQIWSKLKVKTVYEVDFDSNELVEKATNAINAKLEVNKVLVHISIGEQQDEMSEDSLKKMQSMNKSKTTVEKADSLLGGIRYDLIGELAKETKLTRKTVGTILQGLLPEKFACFKVNPEDFIRKAANLINYEKAATLINNVIYSKTTETYDDSIFTINNFKGSLKDNILEVKKHIYDYLKTDSQIERNFAQDMETGKVLIYAKLPRGFVIPTPVGNYNPDWAVVFDTEEYKYIYFIAETKGSMDTLQLREIEQQKIQYARKHFEALGQADMKYDVVSSYQELLNKVMR